MARRLVIFSYIRLFWDNFAEDPFIYIYVHLADLTSNSTTHLLT